MQDWTKVVTEPLGLAGFALFLIFGVFSRLKAKDERRWLGPVASGMAVLALAGGLALAYVKTAREAAAQATSAAGRPNQTQSNTSVQQTTTGAGSPVVQGVQGDVTITVDQSQGTGTVKKPAAQPAGKTKP